MIDSLAVHHRNGIKAIREHTSRNPDVTQSLRRPVDNDKKHSLKSPQKGQRQVIVRSSADDDVPEIKADWRDFRAGLISQSGDDSWNGAVASEANQHLLESQSVQLSAEKTWAHPIDQIEPGCILLASAKAPHLLNDPRMWQLVIFLIEHGPDGSAGVILNRPSILVVQDFLDQMPNSKAILESNLGKYLMAFKENTIYLGGMYSPNKLYSQKEVVIHPHKMLQADSKEIIPGVFIGGKITGGHAVSNGQCEADSFRFFSGLISWAPNQLALETNSGIWHTAACSRNLILKQCLRLPTPLWQEIMDLMGGQYAEMAQEARKQSP